MKYSKICKEFKNFKERLSSELDSKNAFFTLFSGIERSCPTEPRQIPEKDKVKFLLMCILE